MSNSEPIFLQIAKSIEEQILDGALLEEAQVPSTNELALFHRINPATAAKGINLLVERGILFKKRGVGMFVTAGARQKLLAARREEFTKNYVVPLAQEAKSLGLPAAQVTFLVGQTLNAYMAAEDPRPDDEEADSEDRFTHRFTP